MSVVPQALALPDCSTVQGRDRPEHGRTVGKHWCSQMAGAFAIVAEAASQCLAQATSNAATFACEAFGCSQHAMRATRCAAHITITFTSRSSCFETRRASPHFGSRQRSVHSVVWSWPKATLHLRQRTTTRMEAPRPRTTGGKAQENMDNGHSCQMMMVRIHLQCGNLSWWWCCAPNPEKFTEREVRSVWSA